MNILHEYNYFNKEFNYRVKKFNIEALDGNKWLVYHVGSEIGPCKIVRFPEKMSAGTLCINVIKSGATPSLYHDGVTGSWTRGVRK